MNAILDFDRLADATEVRPVPDVGDAHNDFWLRTPRTSDDIVMVLPDACVDELDAVLQRLPALADEAQPQSTTLDVAARNALAATVSFAAAVRDQLEHGPGAAIVDRFPAERWSDADNRRVAGIFSELVAPLKAQAFDGTTLYDVMDRKVEDVSKVRRSITNLAQAYHTDGPWIAVPARYIGLYCIRNAGQGGVSRLTSLLSAFDTLGAEPGGAAHLAELACAQPWDRQGEHAPDDSPWEAHPLLVRSDAGVVARFYESYVRRGHTLADRAISASTDAALAALARVLETQPAIRFLMEPGQFQYANNYAVVHARDAFVDEPAPLGVDVEAQGGRRLVRVWHH